jgi:hypothetical protein
LTKGFLRDGELDGSQISADVVIHLAGHHKQMDMLRHEHVGPYGDVVFFAGSADRLRQPAERYLAR